MQPTPLVCDFLLALFTANYTVNQFPFRVAGKKSARRPEGEKQFFINLFFHLRR